jgi:hypothetical protein
MSAPLPHDWADADPDEGYRRRGPQSLMFVLLAGAVLVAAALFVGLVILGRPIADNGRPIAENGSQDEPRPAAEQFLRQVEIGRLATAYASLCPASREKISRDQFVAAVGGPSRAARHEVTKTAYLDEAGTSAVVKVRVTDQVGGTREISLTLSFSADGGWQVCGDSFS